MAFRLTPPKIKTVENDVEKACLDILRYRGYDPRRMHVGHFKTVDGRYITMGEPGLPDYVIPLFWMEVKAPGKQLSIVQVRKISELEGPLRTPVAVIDSDKALEAWLKHYERNP